MKIVHVSPSLDASGLPRMVQTMCNGLSRRGHEVTVLAPIGELADELDAVLVSLPTGPGRKAMVALARDMRRVVAQQRPDILHVHHRRHALIARAATWGSSTLLVEHAHSAFRDKKMLSFRADHVIAVGSSVQRDIVEYYRRPAGRVSLLKNAVPDPAQATSGRFDDGAVLRLVAVGRLDALKDPGFLDAMVHEMRSRGHRVKVSWAGDGELRPRTSAWTNVEWLGQLAEAEVLDLLRGAHALVSTSTLEGLPLVALQALAVGTPVLARRAGSVADAVEEGRTGTVWPEALAPEEAVRWLDERQLLTVSKLAGMRPRSRRYYEENFTVDMMIDNLESLYRQWVRYR